MTTEYGDAIRVLKAGPSQRTAQTKGMERIPGVDGPTADAKRMWMARVTATPRTVGEAHHHGEAETAAYLLRGKMRVYFGKNYEKYVDAEPGDFLYAPPFLPHIEANLGDEEIEAIVARTPENIVVNLGQELELGGDGKVVRSADRS